MNTRKRIIAFLLLLVFGCMQLVDLHQLDHEHDDSECELCQVFSHDLTKDYYTFVAAYEVKRFHIPSVLHTSTFYTTPYIQGDNIVGFFNKPPPSTFI